MSTEVTPGMFSLAEAKVSWKAPWLMAFFALVVFLGFGLLGRGEPVVFTLSADDSAINLPAIDAMSNSVGMTLGILLFAITALAFVWVLRKRPVPLWWSSGFRADCCHSTLGLAGCGRSSPRGLHLG